MNVYRLIDALRARIMDPGLPLEKAGKVARLILRCHVRIDPAWRKRPRMRRRRPWEFYQQAKRHVK